MYLMYLVLSRDYSLKETEVAQLRSLMGNVAHDLKTPLFAIEADLETLKLFFNCLSDDDVRVIVAKLWKDRHRGAGGVLC